MATRSHYRSNVEQLVLLGAAAIVLLVLPTSTSVPHSIPKHYLILTGAVVSILLGQTGLGFALSKEARSCKSKAISNAMTCKAKYPKDALGTEECLLRGSRAFRACCSAAPDAAKCKAQTVN
jgi:hypothetical protein